MSKRQVRRSKSSTKNNQIGEILGLLEEREKTKDWILEEINRKRIKLSVSPTANSYEILQSTPRNFVNHIYRRLRGDSLQIKDVKTLSKTFHWFFTDIVRSSDPKMTVTLQARKIRTFNEITKKTDTFRNRDPESTIIHWTGDGMAMGFGDSPEKPLKLAIQLHKAIGKHNKLCDKKDRIFVRIGMNTGDIFFIEDVEGKQAFWGDGLVKARRIMDMCGQNQIFASENIANGLKRLSNQNKSILHPIGEYEIKHGEEIFLYNIYGKGFGNKTIPKTNRVQKLKPHEIVESNTASFRFKEIKIILDVKNPKTMMTHHTIIWNVQNLRKDKEFPLSELFYPIEGDIPREFSDLHVKVKDNFGNKLKITTISKNKPTQKEFNVKLQKPIKFMKSQTLTLEYDWEEPDRRFGYLLSSHCDLLKFQLKVPRSLELKNKILKVNPGTMEKIKADPPPVIKYEKNKTIVYWESGKKLKEYETFEFDW